MIDIYSGHEKHIHKLLGKRAVKDLKINPDDIGFIYFNCPFIPNNKYELHRIEVTVITADDKFHQTAYFSKEIIRYGFKITWKNLMKM